MAEAIILAGGYSSRFQSNKILLSNNNKLLIKETIDTLRKVTSKIILVTGRYDKEIREALKKEENLIIVFNKNYDLGMFSSVKEGIKNITDDFFILPGDAPFIKEETFLKLLQSKKQIAVPSYQGQQGHPIFIRKELLSDLKNEDINSNLRLFKAKYDVDVVEVDDRNILNDIDSVEDYEKVIRERK